MTPPLSIEERARLDAIVARRTHAIMTGYDPRETVRSIVAEVAAAAGVSVTDINGPSRRQPIVALRHLAMWRARQAGHSYPAIARAMNRDHTTVVFGVQQEELRQKEMGL